MINRKGTDRPRSFERMRHILAAPTPYIAALLVMALVGACAPAPAEPERQEIRLLSTGPFEDGLLPVIERYTAETGNTVTLETGTTPVVRERLESGDTFDVVIATEAVIDAAAARGQVDASNTPVVGRVGIGVAIRQGVEAPVPASAEELVELLLTADTVAYNRGSSGVYVQSMVESLGITDDIADRTTQFDNGTQVIAHVRDGVGRDMGLAPLTEIQANAALGVGMISLPDDVQNYTAYHAVVGAGATEAAAAFVEFLLTPASRGAFSATGVVTPEPSPATQASETFEPFRVIGNIYYVGAQYGSYLITTPDGHILHDTGTDDMHDIIVSNVESLGFAVEDIRIMISSHAHFDHVEGHAAMKRVTGARVVALGGDAVALETGRDNSAIGAPDFEPVVVDRVIEDGDTVTLGGVTLTALATPGHTQGATMWTTVVEEGGALYSVAFRGGEIPNAGSPLFDNPRHATVLADTQRTLERLRALDPPDLFLHNHPQNLGRDLDPEIPVNSGCATCLDAEGFTAYISGVDATFTEMLREAESAAGR